MRAEKLIQILINIPPDMEVWIPALDDDETYFQVCEEKSEIEEIEDENGRFSKVFILRHCVHRDDLPVSTVTNPN
jgi:hypothetical protein